jgi:hypothetical protein
MIARIRDFIRALRAELARLNQVGGESASRSAKIAAVKLAMKRRHERNPRCC